MKETFHVTFNEANEAIRYTNTKGANININEYISFHDDEILIPRKTPNQYTRTKKVMETMNVSFDELSVMAFEQHSPNPRFKEGLLDISVKPTEKHLNEVKQTFCYLRGTVNMGLWYTKDSGFELIAFSDVDHAGC
nr:uncharacterized mitochondrial protein AtMg00810-like [Tanacetum cinerariifolium]